MENGYLKTDMQKMARMSTEKCESLKFYKYLCQKIGSEEVVRIRRLAFCISDISQLSGNEQISSGSKGEGLDLKGSDMDTMHIDTIFKVYESETAVDPAEPTVPVIMNTEETQPCFTQLRLLNSHQAYISLLITIIYNMWQQTHLGCMLSSEQYKLFYLSFCETFGLENILQIHGPCLSDNNEQFDFAYCLKCDQWIVQAQPWISRPRITWPSPEIISKITSFGVLIVPIGYKGSVNENLEWRISFSVAEKFLIFSFNHTQLLCYALLKVMMKEIVEKDADLKGLLCSYFLKTLLFWVLEVTDLNLRRPDNIIPCFKACLQRLMYCVRYSILSHYFIPENNLFYSRFNDMKKEKLETILKKLYEQEINCFTSSETLNDYQSQSFNIPESLTSGNIIRIVQNAPAFCNHGNIKNVLYHCLHHSRTSLSRDLFALYLSKACRFAPDASKYLYSSENKHQYFKYKYDLSHLLVGLQSDAVSGWLKLASDFYVHKNYFASLRVIDYALQKYTDEKIFIGFTTSEFSFAHKQQHQLNLMTKEYTCIQKQELNLMKKEKLYTILKTLIIEALSFNLRSLIIPQELQLDAEELNLYHPLTFCTFPQLLMLLPFT